MIRIFTLISDLPSGVLHSTYGYHLHTSDMVLWFFSGYVRQNDIKVGMLQKHSVTSAWCIGRMFYLKTRADITANIACVIIPLKLSCPRNSCGESWTNDGCSFLDGMTPSYFLPTYSSTISPCPHLVLHHNNTRQYVPRISLFFALFAPLLLGLQPSVRHFFHIFPS